MEGEKIQSANQHLNKLLETVDREVRRFAEAQTERLNRLAQIGIALSGERNINKLLEMILDEAMNYTNADAGTLYILDEEQNCLRFEILRNRSLNTHMGGTSGVESNLPPVPLEIDGAPNLANVSSHSALTGEMINIPDVYQAQGFDFTGPKKYDQQTGYRSRSMLVVPMKNHRGEVTGVLQMLNACAPHSDEVIPFPREYEPLTMSLASQAAVALENARLIKELEELFDAFIQSIATAIDEKSHYTAGHIRRVTELTMMIARAVNQAEEGPFRKVHFSPEELEELRIAAWLHDVGKITTPEYVVDKSSKLQTIYDRIDLIETRFELIKQTLTNEWLRQKLERLQHEAGESKALKQHDHQLTAALNILENEKKFLINCNAAAEVIDGEKRRRLEQIAEKTYFINGQEFPYLTSDEVYNLSIPRGTLTPEERKVVESHALIGIKILRQLPFPKKLARVPDYAGGHHEKLDGSGYPFRLTAEKLPLQSRIMAVADIFEALTAKDRPYKKPMKLSKALNILKRMSEEKHIDSRLYDLFMKSEIYKRYAKRELNKEQIDVFEKES